MPISGGQSLSLAAIADSVWDEPIVGHTAAGLVGRYLSDVYTRSNHLGDSDFAVGNIAAAATLTLDKAAWNKVFFTSHGLGIGSNVAGQDLECTALDDNTMSITNNAGGAHGLGIVGRRLD